LLEGLIRHLDDFGVGSIAEIFDAEEPYTGRGCIAQAWSVAEELRCWRLGEEADLAGGWTRASPPAGPPRNRRTRRSRRDPPCPVSSPSWASSPSCRR